LTILVKSIPNFKLFSMQIQEGFNLGDGAIVETVISDRVIIRYKDVDSNIKRTVWPEPGVTDNAPKDPNLQKAISKLRQHINLNSKKIFSFMNLKKHYKSFFGSLNSFAA